MSRGNSAPVSQSAFSFDRPRNVSRLSVGIGSDIVRFGRRKPLGAIGGFILVLVVVFGVLSPWIAIESPQAIGIGSQLQPPSAGHWFGTDGNGADIYSKIVYGTQVTAMVGIGTVLGAAIISLIVGVFSGYFGGKTDFAIQRLVDIWMSFPAIFLILTAVAVLGNNPGGFFGLGRGPDVGPSVTGGPWFWNTFPRTTVVTLVLAVVLAGSTSRIIRSAVLSTKANAYVDAAKVVGAGHLRIVMIHIFPNIFPIVIVLATVQLGTAVLAEATLSFLGFGVTNFPTWGQMLSGQARFQAQNHLYVVLFPGFAIFITVFGFNMLGDALRDVLDPRLRRR